MLKKTPFAPGDFSGPVKANVRARFGLVRDQSPPPPQWTADIDLLGVDLKTPIAGRTITEVEGNLVVNPVRADLTAEARIDGVPLDVVLVEPVSQTAGLKRDLTVTGTISEKDRTRLFPGVADLIAGPVGIAVSTASDGSHRVETDLGRSLVQLPWIGWEKGAGVPAKATFALGTPVDGVTRLSDFDFSGDGFTIAGDVSLKDGGLSAARFDRSASRRGTATPSTSNGPDRAMPSRCRATTADVRPVLARLKSSPGRGEGGGTGGVSVSVRADIGRVVGFNGEALRSFKLAYAHDGTRLSGLDLTGVTGSGQAVVAKLSKGGAEQTLEVTTGDAGALAAAFEPLPAHGRRSAEHEAEGRRRRRLARPGRHPPVPPGGRGEAALDRLHARGRQEPRTRRCEARSTRARCGSSAASPSSSPRTARCGSKTAWCGAMRSGRPSRAWCETPADRWR